MAEDRVVPWQQAWQHALYGPRGFYRQAEGPSAHFATSARGVPHGTTVLAKAVVQLARRHRLGHVVDIGAGHGELAADVMRQAPDLHVTGVDVVPRPAHLPASVAWVRSPGGAALPDLLSELRDTLVLAHEWLDVVPCPVVQRDQTGVWRVVGIDPASGREQLGEEPSAAELAWLDRWMPASTIRAEVGTERDRAWADLASRVRRGLVVAVDYGHTALDRPRQGTLTGYRHGHHIEPVPDGSSDLTAHVAVDALVEVTPRARLERQHAVLDDLLGPSQPLTRDLALTQPTTYLGLLAEQAARRCLTDRAGLGGFWWVLLVRDD